MFNNGPRLISLEPGQSAYRVTELNGKKLTGRIAADRIRMTSTPKPPKGAVDRFIALENRGQFITREQMKHGLEPLRLIVEFLERLLRVDRLLRPRSPA